MTLKGVKRKKSSEETKHKLSEIHKELCKNPEIREMMKKRATENWKNEEYRKRVLAWRNDPERVRKCSERISKAIKGRKIDAETRKRMSEGQKKRARPLLETKQKTSLSVTNSYLNGVRGPNKNQKHLWYRGIWFRSSWEVFFAKCHDYWNVRWEYEPISFKLKNGKHYIPDFYLPDNHYYVEIKGYERPRDREKWDEFVAAGNDLRIITYCGLFNEQIDTQKHKPKTIEVQ